MATMNVSLPAPMKAWVEGKMVDGRYSNVSDYVRDLIRRDQEREHDIEDLKMLIAGEGVEKAEDLPEADD